MKDNRCWLEVSLRIPSRAHSSLYTCTSTRDTTNRFPLSPRRHLSRTKLRDGVACLHAWCVHATIHLHKLGPASRTANGVPPTSIMRLGKEGCGASYGCRPCMRTLGPGGNVLTYEQVSGLAARRPRAESVEASLRCGRVRGRGGGGCRWNYDCLDGGNGNAAVGQWLDVWL